MRAPKGKVFSAYTTPSFEFWFDAKWYTVQGAKTMLSTGTPDDISTMRSEYTRMRDAAQKRVKRLQKLFPDTVGAKQKYDTGRKNKDGEPIYASGFQKLGNIDPKDFAYAFAELAKFLKAKGSTVTGQREIKAKTIKTWQDQGLPVNDRNYNTVIKILERARKEKLVYGSDKIVELAETMLEMSSIDENTWLSRLDLLLPHTDELQEIEDLRGYTFDEILEMLGE